jgi:hypothetical protein
MESDIEKLWIIFIDEGWDGRRKGERRKLQLKVIRISAESLLVNKSKTTEVSSP